MISSNPLSNEENGATERSWLNQANLLFSEYHLINYTIQKEEAKTLMEESSFIFLLGGDILLNKMSF